MDWCTELIHAWGFYLHKRNFHAPPSFNSRNGLASVMPNVRYFILLNWTSRTEFCMSGHWNTFFYDVPTGHLVTQDWMTTITKKIFGARVRKFLLWALMRMWKSAYIQDINELARSTRGEQNSEMEIYDPWV